MRCRQKPFRLLLRNKHAHSISFSRNKRKSVSSASSRYFCMALREVEKPKSIFVLFTNFKHKVAIRFFWYPKLDLRHNSLCVSLSDLEIVSQFIIRD